MPVAVPHRHRWARVALERPEQGIDEQGNRWQETCKRCLTCSAESRGRLYPDLLAHVFSVPAAEDRSERDARARARREAFARRRAGLAEAKRARWRQCPTCRAFPGDRCVSRSGRERSPHLSRREID
jgi:hypothetical protein